MGGSSIETSKIAGHANVRMTEEYTIVQLKRQEDFTRRIQDTLAKAKKRIAGKNVVEIKKKETGSVRLLFAWSMREHDSARLRYVRHHAARLHTCIAGYYNPGRQVHEKSDSGTDRDTKPENSHQNDIDLKVSCEASADPGNLLVTLVQHQIPRHLCDLVSSKI